MALSRATLEVILVKRVGAWLTAAGLDGTTVDGTNTDLNDPIGTAIRQAGGSVADLATVADGDLSTFAEADYDKLIGLAELRALETIQRNYAQVDVEVDDVSRDSGQLGTRIDKAVALLTARLRDEYGLAVGLMEAGYIDLNISQQYDDTVY